MQKYWGVLILAMLCSSCSSTYYYASLSQNSKDDKVSKVANGDFKIENDSIWIAYCFNGESAPVQITVYNKTENTLFVDWKRSWIMLNNKTYDYAGAFIDKDDVLPEIAYLDTHPILYSSDDKQIGIMDSEITFPESVSRIPPSTKVSYASVRLAKLNFDKVKSYSDSIIENKYKQPKRVDYVNYTEENAPLKMTSRLYINADGKNPLIVENEFYLSTLVKTKSLPLKNLVQTTAERGDLFYIGKPSKNVFGKPLVAIGKGAVVVVGSLGVYAIMSKLGLESYE